MIARNLHVSLSLLFLFFLFSKQNKNAYIQEFIKMNISVHATIPKKSFLPSEVVFHNVVDSTTYQKLLRESKVKC